MKADTRKRGAEEEGMRMLMEARPASTGNQNQGCSGSGLGSRPRR